MIFRFLYYVSGKKFYGFIGAGLIALSFVHWYFPLTHLGVGFAHFLFYLGNILFFDYLSYKFSGWSPLHARGQKIQLVSQLLLLGLLGGVVLELYAHWFGKLWYYPFWDYPFYLLIFIPGFAFYFFYLLETYLGVKAVFAHFFTHRHKRENFSKYKMLFTVLGLVGIGGLSATTVFLILRVTWGSSLTEFLSIVNRPFVQEVSFLPFFILPVFFWFFLEYIEYERHETSMLSEMFEGNFIPVVAVFLSAWASAFLYEVFNIPGGLWRYANMPFREVTLFSVPVMVYLIWPFHYFPLFALYRILFKRETVRMWK